MDRPKSQHDYDISTKANNHKASSEKSNTTSRLTSRQVSARRIYKFSIYRKRGDRVIAATVEVYPYNTLMDLKDKIACTLQIDRSQEDYALEVFNDTTEKWTSIDESDPSITIQQLKLPSNSKLSYIRRVKHESRTQSNVNGTTGVKTNRELPLRLCVKPKERTSEFIRLNIHSHSTIRNLREKVLTQLKEPINNQPIYRWREGIGWDQFDIEVDHKILSNFAFVPEQYVSIDPDADEDNVNDSKSSSISTSSSINADQPKVAKDECDANVRVPSKSDDKLILRLCKTPKDINNNYIPLELSFDETIGYLRKEAYAKFNKSSNNQPIYLCIEDSWIPFKSDTDDEVLRSQGFKSDQYISIHENRPETSKTKTPSGLCGLANFGNTCFMNSIFQCLNSIPEFKTSILQLPDDIDAPIINEYKKLTESIWSGTNRLIKPSSLLNHIRDSLPNYSYYRQQDAQEFMNHFINLIHAEFSKENTIITRFFYGKIQSTVKCVECKTQQTTQEDFTFIPLPIETQYEKKLIYIKSDGEQCLVSLQIKPTIVDVDDLVDCFVTQYEPKQTHKQIFPYQLVNNVVKKQYSATERLQDINEEELVLIEFPKTNRNETHIWCKFFDGHNQEMFRPPSIFVCPKNKCTVFDLLNQIHQILGHLCSMTQASLSACNVSWKSRNGTIKKIDIEPDTDEVLQNIDCILISMETKMVTIYKEHYRLNYSYDKSMLSSLLTAFFKENDIQGDYYCLKCKRRQSAKHQSHLRFPLPRVLTLQLKRFVYTSKLHKKIDTFISFPLRDLDLNQYIIKDSNNPETKNLSTTYDLIAVSNHTGTLRSGHYTTYAKNVDDGNWYSFDDDLVRKIDCEKNVVTEDAYILLYSIKNPVNCETK